MKIAILTTGDEIMAGNIVDSNAAWISDKCWTLGHNVNLHIAVGDDANDIIGSLKYASALSDVVIISGGLGATVDDITLETASKFFGLKMVCLEDVWDGIKEFFKTINRVCSENNKKQAYMPEGATPLKNILGTAPGVQLKHDDTEYFFLPGVPAEMRQIFNDSIFPWLKANSETPGYYQKFLRCFGLPEATFDQMIKDVSHEGVNLSFRVSFPEVRIKLVARSDNAEMAKGSVIKAANQIREIIGDFIYGEDEELLEKVVGNLLKDKNYKLAVAESCTGGLISKRITDVPGSSHYLDRGFVTYSNRSKIENLGVPNDIITKYGAVSSETAVAMAEGALKNSEAQVALSVTGIAGPTGGSSEKPVGTVHIAVAGPHGTVERHHNYPRERGGFKEIVAETALDMLRRYLLDLEI